MMKYSDPRAFSVVLKHFLQHENGDKKALTTKYFNVLRKTIELLIIIAHYVYINIKIEN